MLDEQTIQRLSDLIAREWYRGDVEYNRRLIEAAVRRWQSFDRRNKTSRPTREHRLVDLTAGLRDVIDPDWRKTGGTVARSDYRRLADLLAPELEQIDDPPPTWRAK